MVRTDKEKIDSIEFEQTIDRYSDSLLRCAYTLCGNREDAEDVVQEVFLRYLRKRPEFKEEQHKKAWLLRVTINLSKDFRKAFWNKHKSELKDTIADESDPLRDIEIWQAVQSLPQKYKAVVELYYHEGCTIEEIAEITGSKRSTVGDRLGKARKMLEKIYKEESL